MDKSTLSNYGWIVIAVLVLAVMIALATPFGSYIEQGVRSTTQGLFDTSEAALNVVGMSAGDGSFGESETETPMITGSTTFTHYLTNPNCCEYKNDHTENCWTAQNETLTWEELKLEKNATKYGYDVSAITDTQISDFAFVNIYGISSMTIPEGVTYIGEIAFQATNCTEISLPSSITFIANDAFSTNTVLTIKYSGTKANWDAIEKAEYWNMCNQESGKTLTIVCSDGTIKI